MLTCSQIGLVSLVFPYQLSPASSNNLFTVDASIKAQTPVSMMLRLCEIRKNTFDVKDTR
jgi:hypothetical protein